jgi:integrase
MLKDWADQLLARDLAASTVNNKIGKLLRGFRLALEEDPPRVRQIPSWKSLKPAPPRSGFFEIEPYLAVRAALPRHAQIPVTIGFWTGMRYGEIRSITWPQVTFQHPEQLVRMQLTGYTKNGLPRQVIMGGDLYATLWAWRQEIQASSCRFVCQRHDRRLGTIDTGWKTACVKLGLATGTWVSSRGMWNNYVGPVFHDLRRTGLRNLIRAGVDRDVAMSISGHLTERVFTRYNIVNEEDLAEAGRKVAAYYAARAQSGV